MAYTVDEEYMMKKSQLIGRIKDSSQKVISVNNKSIEISLELIDRNTIDYLIAKIKEFERRF